MKPKIAPINPKGILNISTIIPAVKNAIAATPLKTILNIARISGGNTPNETRSINTP